MARVRSFCRFLICCLAAMEAARMFDEAGFDYQTWQNWLGLGVFLLVVVAATWKPA